MKTILTKEQSKHLRSLGCKFPNNISIQDNDKEFYIRVGLEDFLNGEILPYEIESINVMEDPSILKMEFLSITKRWLVSYENYYDYRVRRKEEELIDALFEISCWYYGEFLKSEKK